MSIPDSVREVLEQLGQEEKKCLQRLAELRSSKLTLMRLNGIEAESGGGNAVELQSFTSVDPSPVAPIPSSPGNKPIIRPDEFFGATQAEASRRYLKKVGYAVSYSELVDVLKRGGIKLNSADPEHVLWISLIRNSKDFITPQKGFVGLREFYPPGAKSASDMQVKTKRPPKKKNAAKRTSKPGEREAKKKNNEQQSAPEPKPGAKPIDEASEVRDAVRDFMRDLQFHDLHEVRSAASKKIGADVSQIKIRGILSGKMFEQNDEGMYRMKSVN